MNIKDKRNYIDYLLAFSQQNKFSAVLNRRNKFLNSIPTTLFKYSKIKKYTYSSLKTGQIYFAEREKLNDSFDLFFSDNDKRFKEDLYCKLDSAISHKKIVRNILLCINKSKYVELAFPIIDDVLSQKETNILNYENRMTTLNTFNLEERSFIYNIAINFFPTLKDVIRDESNHKLFDKFENNFQDLGVCSLTQSKNTKSMWSHYGDKYAGICIEYIIPKEWDVINSLYPVIYEKQSSDKFEKSIIRFVIGLISMNCTNGKILKGYGAMVEELCAKDLTWKSEDEWRIVGKSSTYFSGLKIKSVYLGYKIKPEREAKILKISKGNFDVFKMDNPNKRGKLTFKKQKVDMVD